MKTPCSSAGPGELAGSCGCCAGGPQRATLSSRGEGLTPSVRRARCCTQRWEKGQSQELQDRPGHRGSPHGITLQHITRGSGQCPCGKFSIYHYTHRADTHRHTDTHTHTHTHNLTYTQTQTDGHTGRFLYTQCKHLIYLFYINRCFFSALSLV